VPGVKNSNDGLTRSGTGCFIAVSIWQQSASKGYYGPGALSQCRSWSNGVTRCTSVFRVSTSLLHGAQTGAGLASTCENATLVQNCLWLEQIGKTRTWSDRRRDGSQRNKVEQLTQTVPLTLRSAPLRSALITKCLHLYRANYVNTYNVLIRRSVQRVCF